MAVIGLVLVPAASSALAQTDATVDPDQASPAGTQYQLPLDSARGDAAPRSPREPASRSGAAPAASDGARDAIHSENGFGSSAQVPGVGHGAPSAGSDQRTTSTKADVPPASSGGRAGADLASVGLVRSPTPDPSGTRVYGLLALGVLLACGVAVAGRLSRRHH